MKDPDNTSTCSSCGAPMRWIKTAAGKPHPVDAKPEKRWVRRVRRPGVGGVGVGGPTDAAALCRAVAALGEV